MKKTDLEKRAKQVYDTSSKNGLSQETDLVKLNEDLQVHRIELEMQNEELRDKQEELESLIDQLQLLYNKAPVGYLVLDEKGDIAHANNTFVELIDMEYNQIIDKQLVSFIDPEDRSMFYTRYKPFFDKPEGKSMSFRLHVGDKVFFMEMEGSRMRGSFFTRRSRQDNYLLAVLIDNTRRKRVEERLSMAMDAGEHGFWDWDIKTGDTYFSPKYFTMLGYMPGELPSNFDTWKDLLHPDDRRVLLPKVNESVLKGESYEIEFRMKCKDKSWKWIKGRGKITDTDFNGKALRLVGTHEDITESKLAYDKLEDSEAKFRSYINYAPYGIFIADEKGKYLELNDAACRLTGYTKDELLQKSIPDMLQKSEVEKGLKHFQKVKEKGFAKDEIGFVTKDGEEKYWEVAAVDLGNGHFMGFTSDITENRTVRQNLKERNDYIETIMDNMPIGFALNTISNGAVKYMNTRFEEIYGWSRDVLTNISIFFENVFPDKDVREKMKAQILADMQSGDPERMKWDDLKIVTADNETRYVYAYNIPLPDQDLMISTVQNVTKRKLAEDSLIKAKEKAEEADKLKTAFLANMSHEIRTPMNGILGFTSLLEKPDLSEEKREKYIEIIKKSGARMLTTVNDLISISKIETGQEELNNKEINPCDMVEEIIEFFKPSAKSKGLDLKYEHLCTDKHDLISLDPSKFTSIVNNLIRNAIKFTDKGSITVTSCKDKKHLKLSVKDTGQGIPKDRQDAIFDRFIQADINDVKAKEGSGLGLSIVKAYVDMMGGEIQLESEPGKGSSFNIVIPIKELKKKAAVTRKGLKDISEIRFKKLLIAEDDEISSKHLLIILEPYADKILHAWSGEEVVELAKQHPDLDLILMDVKMPKMDGYTAAQEIRKFNKDIPIIIQTAYAMSEDRETAMKMDCNGFITKPIEMKELLTLINNISS